MLGPFVAEANPRHDAGIEAVAEEGCQSQNGEDQFNHVFFAVADGASRELVATWLQDLRGRGVPCDTDYAGRSLKGQLTQAARLGAATTIVVRADGASVRRAGREEEPVALDEVLARLEA